MKFAVEKWRCIRASLPNPHTALFLSRLSPLTEICDRPDSQYIDIFFVSKLGHLAFPRVEIAFITMHC